MNLLSMGIEMAAVFGVFALIWLVVFIAIVVINYRKRSYMATYRSHTITVTAQVRRVSLFVDGKFEDEFGGYQVWSATLKATVEGAEIKVRIRRRTFSVDVEIYANGELLPVSRMEK